MSPRYLRPRYHASPSDFAIKVLKVLTIALAGALVLSLFTRAEAGELKKRHVKQLIQKDNRNHDDPLFDGLNERMLQVEILSEEILKQAERIDALVEETRALKASVGGFDDAACPPDLFVTGVWDGKLVCAATPAPDAPPIVVRRSARYVTPTQGAVRVQQLCRVGEIAVGGEHRVNRGDVWFQRVGLITHPQASSVPDVNPDSPVGYEVQVGSMPMNYAAYITVVAYCREDSIAWAPR